LNNIILASASPRRRELMSQVGIKFDVIPSNVDEEPLDGETPEEHVLRLAAEKARDVAGRMDGAGERWVIGSDTIVVADSEIMGKPADRRDAVNMLKKLSGREHRVITAYCIINSDSRDELRRCVETLVRFRHLKDSEIEAYVDSGEPMDKAGAYAIQGLGSFMVEEIRGSYSNVVGLPICQVVEDLENVGALRLFE